MNHSGKLWIAGRWVAGSGKPFQSTCVKDQSVVWEGPAAAAADVDAACRAARAAFVQWSGVSLADRIAVIQRFAESVKADGDQLAHLISREAGKPLWESKTEVAAVIGKAALAIDALQQRRDTTQFAMGEQTAVTRYKPFGVLAVLGPFNFPAHLPNGHIIPALLAGNTLVFKPSEFTPAVGEWMCVKWEQAGLPAGVVNLVQGGRETGAALAAHPELDGLLFTGSSAAGRALHKQFAEWPQKMLALEMGGNNPLVVHRVKNLAAAAYHTLLSAYLSAGQRCTCARRLIYVRDGNEQTFVDHLVDTIQRTSVGFFDDQPEPFMGTVISVAAGRKILAAQESLAKRGGKTIVACQRQRDCDALLSPGLIDMTGVPLDDEEHFGPLLQLTLVDDFESAIQAANDTAYGLSAGLLSDDRECYDFFIARIRAGVVNWNRQTTGASGKLPFGGCGLSGNNRPSGYFAADYCSYPVAALEAETLDIPATLMPGIKGSDG